MSFDNPTADVNSAGYNPDPMTPERERAARALLADRAELVDPAKPLYDFFQWHVIRDDVLVYSLFHEKTQAEKDAIRIRRRDAMKESFLPWIASDIGGLMNFMDDIDDLGKTKTLVKEYGLDPLRRLWNKAGDDALTPWRRQKNRYNATCDENIRARDGKAYLYKTDWLNLLGFLGLQALKNLFPSWRFFSLALQAAQTTAWMFGIGFQFGPILGAFMESVARGLHNVGLPFDPSHNKYNQLLAARVTQRTSKALAAAGVLHPEDRLTVMAGVLAASDRTVLPYIVIPPSEMPDFGDAVLGPPSALWQYLKFNGDFDQDLLKQPWTQAINLAKLAASIPYNIGAGIVNEMLAPALSNWSEATGGSGLGGEEGLIPENGTHALSQLREGGWCPGPFCSAEADVSLTIALNLEGRYDPETGERWTRDALLENLRWRKLHPPEPPEEP